MVSLTITTRPRENPDTYWVKRTATGWGGQHESRGGPAGKNGRPGVFACFEQGFVSCPSCLCHAMEAICGYTKEVDRSDDQLQDYVDQLAAWVATCETSHPDGIIN